MKSSECKIGLQVVIRMSLPHSQVLKKLSGPAYDTLNGLTGTIIRKLAIIHSPIYEVRFDRPVKKWPGYEIYDPRPDLDTLTTFHFGPEDLAPLS